MVSLKKMHHSNIYSSETANNLQHCLSLSSLPLFTFSQNANSSFPFGLGHSILVQKTPEFVESHPQKLQPSVRGTRRFTPSHLCSLRSHMKPRAASFIFFAFCSIKALQNSRCFSFDGFGHILKVHAWNLAQTRQWQLLQPS